MQFSTTLITATSALFALTAAAPAPAWAPAPSTAETSYTLCASDGNSCTTWLKSKPGFSGCKDYTYGPSSLFTIAPGTMCKGWTENKCTGVAAAPMWASNNNTVMGQVFKSFQCMTISDWDAAIAAGAIGANGGVAL